ncbi:KTSC domain-containing protein [Stenotrophomonas pavanii]|uniref:KTSC domain-containing protein n=1 Tax=Stenotrophomonas pavanii TaxID=487698 RepID=UPI000CD1B5B7|nr:KTSC domain-containing protein [Stenotrophomonas pavanii]PNY71522.1 KTSC domain-containing protein [Stenotrophomonas pavanii]
MTSTTTAAGRIQLFDVDSSQIHSIGHDAATYTLAIRFYRGYGDNKAPAAVYHYANFSAEEFQAFKEAESIGKHFGAYIKPFPEKYPYHKVAEQQLAA